jgi:mRNA interferase MazF
VKKSGQIVLFPFPHTTLASGKTRPALLLGKLPGPYGDWLICMISSQMYHYIKDFDEIVTPGDSDFANSGLKTSSIIRVGRLAVVEETSLLGAVGEIDEKRLKRIKKSLSDWLEKL